MLITVMDERVSLNLAKGRYFVICRRLSDNCKLNLMKTSRTRYLSRKV